MNPPNNPVTAHLEHKPKELDILLLRYLLSHVHCGSSHTNSEMEMSSSLWMDNENGVHLHRDTIQLWRNMKSCMLLISGQKRSLWVRQPKSIKTNTEFSFLLEAPSSKSSGVSTYPGEVGKPKETTAGEQRRECRSGRAQCEWPEQRNGERGAL